MTEREFDHSSKNGEIWFPEGPEQSDLRLIEFTPAAGEYWDLSGGNGLNFQWKTREPLFEVEGTPLGQYDKSQHRQVVMDRARSIDIPRQMSFDRISNISRQRSGKINTVDRDSFTPSAWKMWR